MNARLWLIPAVAAMLLPVVPSAQQPAGAQSDVTFTKDIAPILQRSCQQCHNPDGGAPMSLITYDDVRPWARAMKTRTSVGPHAGVMPPWFVEKNIGIQKYKGDISLSDEEIAKVAKWADGGAPRGNPADMPRDEAAAADRGRLDARQAGSHREVARGVRAGRGARQVGLNRAGADRRRPRIAG